MEELVVKKDFTDVYVRKYPAPYLEQMRKVDYRIPDQTKPLYKHLSERLCNYLKRPINILDLGSSYGINSALLNYELIMSELDDFFVEQNPTPSLKEVQNFFDGLPNKNSSLKFYLVDTSLPALEFAEKAGLCEGSFCVNLEKDPVPSEFKMTLKDIDMIIATGCIGYIGWRAFEQIFKNLDDDEKSSPIFAFSVLRIFRMDEIERVFKKNKFNLIKTKIGPLKQRQFYDDQEMKKTLDLLHSRKVDTRGMEETGAYYADFYFAGHSSMRSVWKPWVKNLENVFVPVQGVPNPGA